MKQSFTLPAWLLVVAIVAQLLVAGLGGYLTYKAAHPDHVWTLDSTEYYKTWLGQGKLNLRYYQQQQNHDEELRKLQGKRTRRHRHIDSLSGDALQREIDQQYNNRQPTRGSIQTGTSGPPGDKADTTHRGGRTAGAERPGRSAIPLRRGESQEYAAHRAGSTDFGAVDYDYQTQPVGSNQSGPGRQNTGGTRRLPEEVARSTVGELAGQGRSRRLRDPESAVHHRYWLLIRTQKLTYPDVAWAISAVETGYWYRPPKGRNLFGMKKSRQRRAFYASVSGSGYCLYANERASLADYADYEAAAIKRYQISSRRAYIAHICKRFCPNPVYRGRLALAFDKFKRLV